MAQPKKNGKRAGLFRFIVMFLIFAGLIAATFVLLRPAAEAVRGRMLDARDSFIAMVEEVTGRRLEYRSASPSVFGTLDIRDIRLFRPDDSLFLSISRVRLSFSLWNLLKGNTGEVFHSIGIEVPVLLLDHEKDADLLAFFTAPNPSGGTGPDDMALPIEDFLPEDFTIRIRSGEFEILSDIFSFEIANFNLDGTIADSRLVFTCHWNAEGEVASLVTASANARASGDYSIQYGEGNATVTIPRLAGENFSLQPLTVSVLLRNNRLEIRKVYDRTPVDIAVVWNPGADELSCSFVGDNFSPRRLITLTGSLRNYNPWVASRLSGSARLNSKAGNLDYTVDLRGSFETSDAFGAEGNAAALIGRYISNPEKAASFAVSARGNNSRIIVNSILLDSPNGKISYSGTVGLDPLAPQGRLVISELQLPAAGNFGGQAGGRINGDFFFTYGGQEIAVRGENVNSGGIGLSGLVMTISQESSGFTFLGSAHCTETDNSAHQPGTVVLEGSLDYEPRGIQASLLLDSVSIQNIVDFFSPVVSFNEPSFVRGLAEKTILTTEVFFTTDFEHALYNVPAIEITYNGGDEFGIEASLSGTDRRFALDHGTLAWAGGSTRLAGFVDFSRPDDIDFSLEAIYNDLPYTVQGVLLDGNSLSLSGSYGFELVLGSNGVSGYSGYIQAENIPLPLAAESSQNTYLTLLASLRYDSPELWSARLDRLELADIPSAVGNASLRISGAVDQDAAFFPVLVYDDGLGELSGTVAVNWDRGYSEFFVSAGINGAGNVERYLLDAVYSRDNRLDLNLNVDGMILDRISRTFVNGRVSGDLRLNWDSLESFYAELQVPSFSFQIMDQMLRGNLNAAMDNSELAIDGLALGYGSGLEAAMPNFRLNRLEGVIETEIQARGSSGGQALDLAIRGDGTFTPIPTWLDYETIADSFLGTLVLTTTRNGAETNGPHRFDFSSVREGAGPRITLNGGPRNMVRFSWSPEEAGGGNFYAALSAPSPLRGSFTGFMDATSMDIHVPDLYADMESLWKIMPPIDFIAFPGGIVSGALRIVGPLRDPEFYGAAKVTSLKVRVPDYIPEDIRPIPATVTMAGSEMSFGPLPAVIGNGMGTVTGRFQFEQWIPSIFHLDIRVEPDNAIPAAFEISGVNAKGRVSGNMVLAMENLVFDVSGDLTAYNTEITLNSDELGVQHYDEGASGQVSTMINLLVRSGRQVEFFWPTVEFPIIQAYADIGSGIRVRSDVLGRTFSLTGDVRLRSGEIFYLDRNFYLREGTLRFNENESQFDPRITARAEIRDQSDDGPVTIAMIIDNAPLKSFEPRFESNPALSQLEILSLLGQNQTGVPSETAQDPNLILSFTADALTQFTVMRTLQREVRNFFGLDMFSMRTSLIQNIIFQATGLKNVEEENVRAGNYFDNTTVFLGKYIGADIFVESLFSLKYDPSQQDWGGLRLEPEIGLEMRNPLFDIRMNMILQHPENWFINDVSVSYTWRWAF